MTDPVPGASAELARRHWRGGALRGDERPIVVDQTNRSVIVDETVVVKWLVPPVPAPHPGVRLLAHLSEVGFDEMPRFVGADHHDGQVVAVVTGYVAGALDGWDWFVDEVTGWLRGERSGEAAQRSAEQVGALAARLHVALATPSSVIPEPLGRGNSGRLHTAAERLCDRALAVAEGRVGEVLRAREARVRAALAPLAEAGAVTVQPAHGDLHVGQVLRSDGRLLVTDFDGNPVSDAATRHEPRPAACDVASLVQSVDHVGRVAARRLPEHAGRAAAWAVVAAECTLESYRTELARLRHAHLCDERLLTPLRVAQELHELVYAATHLPRWAFVPEAVLLDMFPPDGEAG